MTDDLVFRLRERARIRRQIPGRKSVVNGEPDRIANLLDEAANVIESLQKKLPKSEISDGLDAAIQDELDHPPKSIMKETKE